MANTIQNEELLTEIFGNFPSFHDAEVIRVTLEREYKGAKSPTLISLIRVFVFTPSEGPEKRLRKDYDVNLIFTQIFGLKLENFNHQNVLGSLSISDFTGDLPDNLRNDFRLLGLVSRERVDNLKFYVKFYYCFGIEAEFFCESVIVNSVRRVD